MNKKYEPYSPAQAAAKLSDLRMAAEQLHREEFERIFTAVQLKFDFDKAARS
jgi:hypothetical protein